MARSDSRVLDLIGMELGYDYGVLRLRIKNIDKDECP